MSEGLALDRGFQADKITSHAYYEGIQEEIREKFKKKDKDNQKTKQTEASKKVTLPEDTVHIKMAEVKDAYKSKSMTWQKDETNRLSVDMGTKDAFYTDINLKTGTQKTFQKAGVKIDYSEKVEKLKESYMKYIIQSTNNNYLLSKFAQFKVGLTGMLLAQCGIPVEILKKLKSEAYEKAAEENIQLMSENIYNMEAIQIVKGNRRDSRRTLRIFRRIEIQLMVQMQRIGKPDYWTKAKLLEERITQCQKIVNEFNEEKNNLTYRCQYLGVEENEND